MIPRLGAAAVVLFWAVMWALLIRSELSPRDALVNRVPVELVLRQAFQNSQASHLFLYRGTERLGHVRVAPHLDESDSARVLDLFGNFQVDAPGAPSQRIAWEASLDLDAAWSLRMARGTMTTRLLARPKPEVTRLEWDLSKATQHGHFRLLADDSVVEEQSFELSPAGLRGLLKEYGAEGPSLDLLPASTGSLPRMEALAQRTRISIRGQEIEAYLVTLRLNEQTLLEAKVTELGQILEATTLVGWTLRAE